MRKWAKCMFWVKENGRVDVREITIDVTVSVVVATIIVLLYMAVEV